MTEPTTFDPSGFSISKWRCGAVERPEEPITVTYPYRFEPRGEDDAGDGAGDPGDDDGPEEPRTDDAPPTEETP